MDQVNAMQQYITKLQSALSDQTKQNKELEVRNGAQQIQLLTLEEKLEQIEIKYSKEKEQVETLEIKVDEQEKKLRSIQESKKPGFLGKMFSSNQIDQYIIKIKDLEQSLDLQSQETEQLHVQLFKLKTQLSVAENKIEEEQKTSQKQYQKMKQLYQSEKLKKEKAEQQNNSLQIAQCELANEISELKGEIEQMKKDVLAKDVEITFNQQLLDKNSEDLRKLTTQLIEKQFENGNFQKEKEDFELFVTEMKNYAIGLQLDSQYTEVASSLLEIISKIHQKGTMKELYLCAKPENYNVFRMAQEKILKLGKKNEQLIKQNKQLQDRLQLQKSKQE